MAKKSNIYTKTGDDGTTGLVGGSRVNKYDIRLEAYGTVDELNAHMGALRLVNKNEAVSAVLEEVQNKLFNIGSRLASDDKGAAYTAGLAITDDHVSYLENSIDTFESYLKPLNHFILPSGCEEAVRCHIARTVCRRAERRILEFASANKVEPEIIRYMNRLSDLLFVLSRFFNQQKGIEETKWKH